MPKIIPNLWFNTEGEHAAAFYVSIFPNSAITKITRYGEDGPGEPGTPMSVDFVLDGQQYTALNGGTDFRFTEAISLLITCADQAEVDYYWDALIAGGRAVECGWLTDKFGLFWQVVPVGLDDLLGDPDQARAQRALQAMFGMTKLDLAELQAAADAV